MTTLGTYDRDDSVGLYVHFPWCVRKCPYCDFNSHPLNDELPEQDYVATLKQDWLNQLSTLGERKIGSVFFGGGTPSLFSPDSFAALIELIAPKLEGQAEITMEANPGTLEYGNLADYRGAGINRLSMGVQSFDDAALQALGRIHSGREAHVAIEAAQNAGFDNINVDLMHGLPEQTVALALDDLHLAVGAGVQHISWYQLTIEPRTEFMQHPPVLPEEDVLTDIEAEGLRALDAAGFQRYEISAYAQPGHQSKHNRNYWEFGDYLGIGAGAAGKMTESAGNGISIKRTAQPRQPRLYLQQHSLGNQVVPVDQLAGEFMMNALRLIDGTPEDLYEQRTGEPLTTIAPILSKWRGMGLLAQDRLALTPLGLTALDTVTADFLPD